MLPLSPLVSSPTLFTVWCCSYHLWNFIQQNMESSVWSKLPGNVQILILEKLPLLDLGSMSLTCKYFNSLLSDPSFAIYYDQHPTIFVSFSGHPTLSVSFPLDERMHQLAFNSVVWQERRPSMLTWQNPFHDSRDTDSWFSTRCSCVWRGW